MRVLFIEPPKDFWFIMGEYLPPPLGILNLASYLETKDKTADIEVLDCQAESIDWRKLEKRIATFNPDVVAPSALATCNTHTVIRTLEIVKKLNPNIVTVVGGQHFTALAEVSLTTYSEIDVIVRGEGEQTVVDLVHALEKKLPLSKVAGISFKKGGRIIHNADRQLIDNLDRLPFPGYHFVKDHMKKYHFKMMAGAKSGYALIEASRGCPHHCSFCSQWRFWGGVWRRKSPKRIADEIKYCHREFGSRFIWLTDDNLGLGANVSKLCDELISREIPKDIFWFMQVRSDDVVKHADILQKMRRAGNRWMLMGLESHSSETLQTFHKDVEPTYAKNAVDLLRENDIFSQATFIIGERKDTHESIERLRAFTNEVNPDLAIFMVLTPFPGTELYKVAKRNGWIEDENWTNYDMVHAIMATETLSKDQVQEELFDCYRSFYGSISRRFKSIFSPNSLKRKTYRYLASQGLLKSLRELI